MAEAIDSATTFGRGGRGCVIVAASGNYGENYVRYPAALSSVISVGAVDNQGARWKFLTDGGGYEGSNYGTNLDICGPGVGIYTTDLQGSAGYNTASGTAGDYVVDNGTSLSSPAVAAVACLVISVNPCLTGQQVRDIIESTAQKVGGYNYDKRSFF